MLLRITRPAIVILLSATAMLACAPTPRHISLPAPPPVYKPTQTPPVPTSTLSSYLAVAYDTAIVPFVGNSVHVRIKDKLSDQWLPILERNGTYYIAGRQNTTYFVNLRSNQDQGRVLAVVSIDGLNPITSETASTTQKGFILPPRSQYDILTIRKYDRDVHALNFSAVTQNLSNNPREKNKLGVIAVAVFQEHQNANIRNNSNNAETSQQRGQLNRTPAQIIAQNNQNLTAFQRARQKPDELIMLRYDSIENLINIGLLQWVTPKSPVEDKRLSKFVSPGYTFQR